MPGEEVAPLAESFRVKKGFTIVQNSVSRDRTLSEKALGLYVRIQSWITLPNPVSKSFLMGQCCSGEKAFESSWKELQRRGYLKTYQYRAPNSVTFDTEHDLLEKAEPDTPYFYIVTRPAGRISTVWYYDESVPGTQNGLSVLLDGDAVQTEDRLRTAAALAVRLGRPPQNRGGCSGEAEEGTPRDRTPCERGDILNIETTPGLKNKEEVLLQSSDVDENGDALYGASPEILEEGRRLAERLYSRFALGRFTEADVTSVLRCVCLRADGTLRVDRERTRLLTYAFDQARQSGAPGNWNYINGVLARLYDRGLMTLEAAEQYDQMRLESLWKDGGR